MRKIKELEKEMIKRLGYSNVEVLYDDCAREYVTKRYLKEEITKYSGFIDVDSYFADSNKEIVILIFNSNSKYVYGTIAHEFKHAEQLLNNLIQPNTDKGKFKCELQAYKAGRKELKKHNKFASLMYCILSLDGIVLYLYKYIIKPKFSILK